LAIHGTDTPFKEKIKPTKNVAAAMQGKYGVELRYFCIVYSVTFFLLAFCLRRKLFSTKATVPHMRR